MIILLPSVLAPFVVKLKTHVNISLKIIATLGVCRKISKHYGNITPQTIYTWEKV